MTPEIITVTFYILVIITITLQLIMYFERARFLRTLQGQPVIAFRREATIRELTTKLRIWFPTKLPRASDPRLEELRRSAVNASNYWMISLSVTLIIPAILSQFLE